MTAATMAAALLGICLAGFLLCIIAASWLKSLDIWYRCQHCGCYHSFNGNKVYTRPKELLNLPLELRTCQECKQKGRK